MKWCKGRRCTGIGCPSPRFFSRRKLQKKKMIDQHLVELQLLHSAAVVNKPEMNGNSPGVVHIEMMKSKTKQGRRGLSDVDVSNKSKHPRRPSDIDSLSPEVLRALQSTFGGKLNEIRSQFQPPPSVPSPPPSLPPSPPASPPRPSPVLSEADKHTFVERLADKEGAYMLIAYFSAIFLSGFILLATEEDDFGGNIDPREPLCVTRVDSSCARMFGVILPSGLAAVFFTFALVFFVFDVSFGLFSILTTAQDLLHEKKNTSASVTQGDDVGKVRPSAAGLALPFVIYLGFIITPSALLWISKTSTWDPLYTVCEQRLQLLWMLGLMVMVVVILMSAITSFRNPPTSKPYVQTAAKTASIIFCLLLACTALYYSVTEPKEVGPCFRALAQVTIKENQIQLYENSKCDECCGPLQQCGWSGIAGLELREESNWSPDGDYRQCPNRVLPKCDWRKVPDMLPCEWLSNKESNAQCKKACQRLDWCEASYSQKCDWPLVKQIQLYERKDRCPVGFPQCDWPLAKQIQAYEDKDRCQAQDLLQCEWPGVKQIQLYEHEERCQVKDEILHKCDWPRLKQVQLYEARDRCPLTNPEECEWPWLKQIQLYEIVESSQKTCRCTQQPTV